MQTLLLVAELFIAAALIIFVLLQRSEGGALGMGGGSGGGMGGLFSPRGAADTLTRTTAILALLFFLTCIGLNLLALHGRDERSILDSRRCRRPTFGADNAGLARAGRAVRSPSRNKRRSSRDNCNPACLLAMRIFSHFRA